jgi:hypothetical protein
MRAMYEGFCIGCKNTAENFLSCSMFSYPLPQSALHGLYRIALPPLLPATSETPHIVT